MDLKGVKKQPRLQFSRVPPPAQPAQKKQQEKQAVQRAQKAREKTDKAVSRAEKAAKKADRAELRLPQKAVRRSYFDPKTGKMVKGVQYQTKNPPKQIKGSAAQKTAVARAALQKAGTKLSADSGNDTDATSAQLTRTAARGASTGLYAAESAVHGVRKLDRTRRRHPYQKAARAEKKLGKKNVKALRRQAAEAQPTSNPISKLAQRRRIKKGYALRYRQAAWGRDAQPTQALPWSSGVGVRTLLSRKKHEFVASSKRYLWMLGGFGFLLLIFLELFSSCGMLLSGIGGSTSLSAYQAADEDILAAESYYCQMEADLQITIDNYEAEHDYDEYHYTLDEIGHDPYVLISLVCAMNDEDEVWTFEDVKDDLEDIFEEQYQLTEEVVEEEREKPPEPTEPTEPEPQEPSPTGPAPVPHPGPNQPVPQSNDDTEDGEDTETVTVEICTVTLTNANLSHLPVYLLSEGELERYSVYMKSLGWRPDLFPDSPYVALYSHTGGYAIEIPTEALEDEVFAAMMQEATKYLGYPYVWGGSTPETSFDCSGFVCWVINHTEVNGKPVWESIGRRNVDGVYAICTPTNTPHPGDLVFFRGTYDTPGFSHIGIYVGDHKMLHCGDPIGFADLNAPYWQQHFAGYGKLPEPAP